MEKNVTIIDENGVVIGYTYPKRAKGLVKKGRAEPVDENCICMKDKSFISQITDTQVPTVDEYKFAEVHKMSKVIGFEARKFGIDPTCTGNNIANRMFVTDALGNNVEVYEIGDWGHNWTQISYEMPVEKDTDFEFLFAMTGDIDEVRGDAKCNFIVMPIHEKAKVKAISDMSASDEAKAGEVIESADADPAEDPGKDDWNNRYQYSLLHREYRPTMEKVWNGSSIRFYRIPFNTGDADKIKFVFVAFQKPYKIFPVKNFEEYADLPDYNLDGNNDWFGRKQGFGGNRGNGGNNQGSKNGWGWGWNRGSNGFGNGPSGWYSGPKGFNEADKKATENFLNNIGMMVSNAVKEAMEGFEKFQKCNFGDWENKAKRSNKNPYSENGYGSPDATGAKKPEKASRKMDTYVLAQLLSKVEDNGDLDLNGYCIEDCDEARLSDIDIETADVFSLSINNASMSGDAFYAIMKKVGLNSDVSCNNSIIGQAKEALDEIGGFGGTSDATSFSFVNSTLSEAAFAVLLSKIGDNCDVDLSNAEIKDFNEIKWIDDFCNNFDAVTVNVENTRISKRLYHMLVRCCGDNCNIEGNAVIW